MDFYYQGAWRMDWNLGNPNKTAALIACLMITVWVIAMIWRQGFWFVLPIFTALGWYLVQTYSRGGMLALLVGSAVLLAWTPRPWPKARWIAVMVSLWIVGFFVLFAKAEARYSQGLFGDDQSIDSRLIIWRHFPEMLAAAPWGWGWGRAGDSYTQWFQPTNQSLNYLNLINSHFTWMTEGGWIFSVLYLFAWVAILLICWPSSQGRVRAVPLGVWVAFGVSGFFSHVEESIWLWILPLLLLGLALWNRGKLKQWPTSRGPILGGILCTCAVVALIKVGQMEIFPQVRANKGAVILGIGAQTNVIFVDRAVMGKLFGHTLRSYIANNRDQVSNRTFIITESPDFVVPTGVHQIIVSGQLWNESKVAAEAERGDHVTLVNPGGFPDARNWDADIASKFSVYFGEYSQSPFRASWESFPSVKSLFIKGAGDFVPASPQVVFTRAGI